MTLLRTLWLAYRAARAARMTFREVVKMLALLTLAGLAWAEESVTYRMHVGAARGVFRKAAARLA